MKDDDDDIVEIQSSSSEECIEKEVEPSFIREARENVKKNRKMLELVARQTRLDAQQMMLKKDNGVSRQFLVGSRDVQASKASYSMRKHEVEQYATKLTNKDAMNTSFKMSFKVDPAKMDLTS